MTMFCGERRRRFEEDGVDDGIADKGGERQPHGQRIDEEIEQGKAGGAQ